jgi:hypothetical protein
MRKVVLILILIFEFLLRKIDRDTNLHVIILTYSNTIIQLVFIMNQMNK